MGESYIRPLSFEFTLAAVLALFNLALDQADIHIMLVTWVSIAIAAALMLDGVRRTEWAARVGKRSLKFIVVCASVMGASTVFAIYIWGHRPVKILQGGTQKSPEMPPLTGVREVPPSATSVSSIDSRPSNPAPTVATKSSLPGKAEVVTRPVFPRKEVSVLDRSRPTIPQNAQPISDPSQLADLRRLDLLWDVNHPGDKTSAARGKWLFNEFVKLHPEVFQDPSDSFTTIMGNHITGNGALALQGNYNLTEGNLIEGDPGACGQIRIQGNQNVTTNNTFNCPPPLSKPPLP